MKRLRLRNLQENAPILGLAAARGPKMWLLTDLGKKVAASNRNSAVAAIISHQLKVSTKQMEGSKKKIVQMKFCATIIISSNHWTDLAR